MKLFRAMHVEDYDQVNGLWRSLPGVRLDQSDERGRFEAYLERNPKMSFVCELDSRVIGTILCGNDGRRAFIYHLAVAPEHRRNGIAAELLRLTEEKQKVLGMDKCVVFVLNENTLGKSFWTSRGFACHHEAETMSKRI
jgi:ribosomal protein S18 acetylase RimI-like enzyme